MTCNRYYRTLILPGRAAQYDPGAFLDMAQPFFDYEQYECFLEAGHPGDHHGAIDWRDPDSKTRTWPRVGPDGR